MRNRIIMLGVGVLLGLISLAIGPRSFWIILNSVILTLIVYEVMYRTQAWLTPQTILVYVIVAIVIGRIFSLLWVVTLNRIPFGFALRLSLSSLITFPSVIYIAIYALVRVGAGYSLLKYIPVEAGTPLEVTGQTTTVKPSEDGREGVAETPEKLLGKNRSPASVFLLGIITLGIYILIWFYRINKEMKLHTNWDDKPGIALFALFIPIANFVSYYRTAKRVRRMQELCGSQELLGPGGTFAWLFLPLAGVIIYISMVQGALNRHWNSHRTEE